MAMVISSFAAYPLAFLNQLFSLSAIFTNLLIIVAIVKTPSLHTPSNVLLCSLALSDFGIGLVQSVFAISLFHGKNAPNLRPFFNFACLFLLAASFLTMASIAVDRCLALLLHLKYRSVVTVRRSSKLTFFLWFFSLLGNILRYIFSFKVTNIILVVGVFLCLITSSFCYFQIYLIVRRHRRQIRDQASSYPSVPTARQGKSIKTMYYIHGLFALCVIPYPIGIGFYIHFGPRPDTVTLMCGVMTLMFLNSSINPYLYCWRIREMRKVIVSLLRSLKICFKLGWSTAFSSIRKHFLKYFTKEEQTGV